MRRGVPGTRLLELRPRRLGVSRTGVAGRRIALRRLRIARMRWRIARMWVSRRVSVTGLGRRCGLTGVPLRRVGRLRLVSLLGLTRRRLGDRRRLVDDLLAFTDRRCRGPALLRFVVLLPLSVRVLLWHPVRLRPAGSLL